LKTVREREKKKQRTRSANFDFNFQDMRKEVCIYMLE